MNTGERVALVTSIHGTSAMLVLAVAGGGNAVITDLLDVPGASRTILEVTVPYAETALAALVGSDSVAAMGAVSSDMAEAMAVACLARARSLAPDAESLLGVAVTAALASDRPKKGEHRAYLAIADHHGVVSRKVTLTKGELDRQGEDRVVADAVLAEVATRIGIGPKAHYSR